MARGRKTGGRKRGVPNKISGTVRENVIQVFDQIGGLRQMAQWAQKNRTEFYRLYAKLLPVEVKGEVSHEDSLTTLLCSLSAAKGHLIESGQASDPIQVDRLQIPQAENASTLSTLDTHQPRN